MSISFERLLREYVRPSVAVPGWDRWRHSHIVECGPRNPTRRHSVYRTLLKSKLHRATVTGSDLNYVGSITIDADLLDLADVVENEQVHVVDVNNGSRFETYTIAGDRG